MMIIKYCYNYYTNKNGMVRKPFACVIGFKEEGQIKIGYSICCPKDKFIKKSARLLALDRADLGDKSPWGKNPNFPIDMVQSYQFYHNGTEKYKWLTHMPKGLVIEQAIEFVKNKLCG